MREMNLRTRSINVNNWVFRNYNNNNNYYYFLEFVNGFYLKNL